MFCVQFLTFGRTREHFVTIPSTQTKFPRYDEVKVRGVTCFDPKLQIINKCQRIKSFS